jgi:hypothetical protein
MLAAQSAFPSGPLPSFHKYSINEFGDDPKINYIATVALSPCSSHFFGSFWPDILALTELFQKATLGPGDSFRFCLYQKALFAGTILLRRGGGR